MGTLWKYLKKIAKKSLTKPKKPAQKIFGQGRDSNPRTRTHVLLSVAQFSVSASQLIKLIKSVSSLVLKKEKSLL